MKSKYLRIYVLCLVSLASLAGKAIGQPPNVLVNSISRLSGREEVAGFLRPYIDEASIGFKIGDFRKIDLDGDGQPELVASIDYSGRNFFNTLVVAFAAPAGTRIQTIDVWNMEMLDGVFQDLDGDGLPEILVNERLTPYLGTIPYALWTSVRSLSAGGYVDSSSHFPTFYETRVLPRLATEISRLRNNGDALALAVKEIERDKVFRLLGRDKEAGLSTALEWAEKQNPVSRLYAAAVLREIDAPEAARMLERLGDDPDQQVRAFAKELSNRARQQRPN